MATPFSYPNNITAGTPAVAAEVQDNFDDLLDWIDSYYQQTADTTAEIAAAIAANGGPVAFAECSAAVATGSITLDTKFAIPGLTATWTADPTHIYRIDVEQIAWLFSAGTTSHRHAVIVSDSASGFTGYTVWQVESDSATTGGDVLEWRRFVLPDRRVRLGHLDRVRHRP